MTPPGGGVGSSPRRCLEGGSARLITLAMATEIDAPRAAVWAALADPEESWHWRPGVTERLRDGASGRRGQAKHRFRAQLHDVPVVLEEMRLATVLGEKLRSELHLGLFRFEETFSLTALGRGRTRLGLKVTAPNRMPIVGGSLDRFDVRRFATDLAGVTLQAVRDWCEARHPERHGAAPRHALPDAGSAFSLVPGAPGR